MLDELVKSGQKDIQVIIFKLGDEEYAVSIDCVQEIVLPQQATRIPKSPEYVAGVINLRGNIIPVVDGKKKFQIKESTRNEKNEKRIMVIEMEDETIGLTVDGVYEVIHLNVNEIEPPPIDMDENAEIFWGIGKYDSRLLILINAEKFISINEEKGINTFKQVAEVIKQVKSAA